jgi:hypothetical protein
MPLRKLQEIIIDYAQHLYVEGQFRAVSSSIEYPYKGAAFAFSRNGGDRLEFKDNTQEPFTLPGGERIMAPADHRGFRAPKSNQVRAAFLRFQFWEDKIHRIRNNEHASHTDIVQQEIKIITARLIPLAVEILKPAAESYATQAVDPETGQQYWRHTACDLSYRDGMLESGQDVPAEIQVKVEEFNDLLRETERGIEAIKKDEAQSTPSDLQSALKRTVRLLQEIVVDYARDIETKQQELSTTVGESCHPYTLAIEKGRLAVAETKIDPAIDAAGSGGCARGSRIRGIEAGLHKKRMREITGALLKFALYQREAEKDESGGAVLIKDKLFPLTAKILGHVARSYSAAMGAQGGAREHRACGKVQFIDGELCADEDLPPDLSVKVEEANLLGNKLLQHADAMDPRELAELQAILQKRHLLPAQRGLRSSFRGLAIARRKREDDGQREFPPGHGIRKKAISKSAVSGQSIDSIERKQREGIPKRPHPRSGSNNKRGKSRKPVTREDSLASERRKAVQAYIDEVFEKSGKRITRAEIWRLAHYKDRTDFERWQRNDPKATRTANERFTQLLKEKPHLK